MTQLQEDTDRQASKRMPEVKTARKRYSQKRSTGREIWRRTQADWAKRDAEIRARHSGETDKEAERIEEAAERAKRDLELATLKERLKVYQILTEDVNKTGLLAILDHHFQAYNITATDGRWKGADEKSLIIEVTGTTSEKIEKVAEYIRHANRQDAVLVRAYDPAFSKFHSRTEEQRLQENQMPAPQIKAAAARKKTKQYSAVIALTLVSLLFLVALIGHDTKTAPSGQGVAQIQTMLNDWATAMNGNNLAATLGFYSDNLDRYFLARNVTRDFVASDKEQFYRKGRRLIDFHIDNVSIDLHGPNEATVWSGPLD